MTCTAVVLACLISTLQCVEGKEKKFSTGGVEVKIDEKGGKFKIYRKDAGENETNKIEIKWDSLQEVDSLGEEVLKDGKANLRHSIKDFKKQDFQFDEPTIVKLMDLPNSANATKLSFTSTVNDVGFLKVETFIVENAGVAGPDEESLWNVAAGDMKFNIELSQWKFCGQNVTCDSKGKAGQVGEFVDVEVEIKGKSDVAIRKPEKSDGGRSGKGKKSDFQLGGNINLMLTNLISIDGNITEMPEGYPKSAAKGHGTVFTFRFPRFKHTALYDPLITTGSAVGVVTAGALGLGSLSVFAATVVGVLASFF